MKRLTDDDLRRLLLQVHVHANYCYGTYRPCGEHHAHDDSCGARPLVCGKPEDPNARRLFAIISELLQRRAADPTAEERAALQTARDVASNSNFPEREKALAMLDRLVRDGDPL